MYRSQQRHRTIFCLLLGGLGACASTSKSPGAQSAQISTSVRSDANVLALLHASNVGEITSSVMAQARATDSAVKSFATMMVSEHTTLDQQANALARQIGVTPALPDSTLPEIQRSESDSLRGTAAGADFDRTYIGQQVVAHQRTLSLVDASITIAQHAELKTALQTQVRPSVVRHLSQARDLQSRLGGVAASRSTNPSGANAGRPATPGVSNGSVTENPPASDTTGGKKP